MWKPSSSRFCTFEVELRTFLPDLMNLSQVPPWYEPALGGLEVHMIPFWIGLITIRDRFRCPMAVLQRCSSHCQSTVPASDRLSCCKASRCIYERIRVQWRSHFKVNCTYCQTGRNDSAPLHYTPPALHLKRSEIAHSDTSTTSGVTLPAGNSVICRDTWALLCLLFGLLTTTSSHLVMNMS